MTKKLLSIYFLFILFFSHIHGVVFEVKDLSKFEKEVSKLDSNALVLFDVDYTLITPKDASLKPCGNGLRRQFLHVLDPKRRERLQSILGLEGDEELMDSAFPSLIKRMQKKNIPVIGFTALETGEYGKMTSIEDWRINQLKKLDIDFTPTFHDKNPMTLTECNPYNNHYPVFKNGVLFTNRKPKGEVFTAFLERLGWKPDKLLFIDDSMDQVQSVESAANTLDIEFIGFHYVAAKVNPCEFDQKLGEFQFQNLVENERWLPRAF